jgi:hypothetical protein
MKTVYWSPFSVMEKYPRIQLLYDTPDPLLADLIPRRNKDANGDNWFQCHAFQGSIKNTFILRLPFEVTFGLDSDLGIFPIGQERQNNLEFVVMKQPSVLNAYTFAVRGNWIFWSEDSLNITTSPAHYHAPVFDGYYVGGSFDIGKWFRPVEGAIQLNKGVDTVHIKRNDPIAYVKFNTEEPVQLKRFYMTKELEELHWGCVKYKQHDPHRGLQYLYDKFTKRGLHNVITNEIKRNVVD